MSNIKEFKFEDKNELLEHLKENIIMSLSEGIKTNNKASMLLSGGTTPGPLYKIMSQTDLEWEKVFFAPTDERWVEPDHSDSNEKLIRETLIQNQAYKAHYIGLKTPSTTPDMGQIESEELIDKMPRPFDIVLLGMGTDGHTASLFPGVKDAIKAMDENNDQLCAAIKRGDGEVDRMTMTLNCLLNSKKVILFFYGNEKIAVYEKAKKVKTLSLPVSYLLHQNKTPIELYWSL